MFTDTDIANSMLMYALEQVFLVYKSVFIHTKIIKTGFPWYLINIAQPCVNKLRSQRTRLSPGAEAALELPAWHQMWHRSRGSACSPRRKLRSPRAVEQPSDSHACWILSCRRYLQGDEIKMKRNI